jgi:MFS transporter, DHA1 family, inner membrane transport protein
MRTDHDHRTPWALYALTAGAFGIGTTEFVIMGLLTQIASELHVSIAAAGVLISGYALGVFVGAPLLTLLTSGFRRKTVLIALMVIFTVGNIACAVAPSYEILMVARVITSLAHGTFFGVGAVVATELVAADRRASAISTMFSGLTVATLLGVPAGTWLGFHWGWRSAFWAVAAIGVAATAIIIALVPRDERAQTTNSRRDAIKILAIPQVVMGLVMTALGFAGLFTVFTYIEPILTRVTGFPDAAVSPILLVFGVGFIVGNILGGRLADRHLARALIGTLFGLFLVLAAMSFALHSKHAMIALIGLLGAAAFATVAPLQLWVLQRASGSGQSFASSLNIGAFNLGNALGAWLGAQVIIRGFGLSALPFAATGVALFGLLVAVGCVRIARTSDPASGHYSRMSGQERVTAPSME